VREKDSDQLWGLMPLCPDCDDGRRPRGGAPSAASVTGFQARSDL